MPGAHYTKEYCTDISEAVIKIMATSILSRNMIIFGFPGAKMQKNWYIEEHLYGAMTHLTCHIENPQYGIDLSAFGQSRGEENEVVYPMAEANIDRVEYIERD